MTEADSDTGPDFRGIVALVVEKNDLIRGLVTHVLADLGIVDVRRVASEIEGFQEFARHPAHIVIVEFGREHAAARELLLRLRRSPHCVHGDTGLIALVPNPDHDTVLLAREAGAEAVVAEPFSPKELADHVSAIVRRHIPSDATRRAS